MDGWEAKTRLSEAFAGTAKAVASSTRIDLLDLLAQGERRVEELARATGLSVANTSAHLQVLRHARLVETRRAKTKVFYRLADDDVVGFLGSLRDLARSRLAEVDRVVREYFTARDAFAPIGRAELIDRAGRAEVIVLDVRPAEEYRAGHIPGAWSVPLDQLDAVLDRLPTAGEIVAYCRGPCCVLATQAVARLRAHGFAARRLAEGMPQWRLAGLPVAVGEQG